MTFLFASFSAITLRGSFFHASGGVPTTLIISGGKPSSLIIEHVWVEAYLPYGNYRGKIKGEGGYQWVPLDPSFKWYRYYPAKVNLSYAMSFNATEFFSIIMNQSTINESDYYITSVNQSFIMKHMENITNSIYNYLIAHNLTNLTLNELLGYREIIPEKLGSTSKFTALQSDGEESGIIGSTG